MITVGSRSTQGHSTFGLRSVSHEASISAETRYSACLAALEQARLGILIVDTGSRVRWMSDGAERALMAQGLSVSLGRLQAASSLGTRRLHVAINRTIRDQSSNLVSLPVQQGGAAQLTLAPMRSETCQPAADQLALVVLGEPELEIDPGRLAESYALTPSEARLLSALVKGERLVDYAARLGVKLTTAKTHLRSLFEKTGERRQADLIRKALSEPGLRLHLSEQRPCAMRAAA